MDKDFILNVEKKIIVINSFSGVSRVEDALYIKSCKTLQNNKALLSTTVWDGMYYEATYNGDKNEMYLDAYKKWDNKCIKIEE